MDKHRFNSLTKMLGSRLLYLSRCRLDSWRRLSLPSLSNRLKKRRSAMMKLGNIGEVNDQPNPLAQLQFHFGDVQHKNRKSMHSTAHTWLPPVQPVHPRPRPHPRKPLLPHLPRCMNEIRLGGPVKPPSRLSSTLFLRATFSASWTITCRTRVLDIIGARVIAAHFLHGRYILYRIVTRKPTREHDNNRI